MQRDLNGVVLECVIGDIASQADMTAVVNAANARLRTGGGVAGALHRKAGPGLEEECRPFAPIRPGQAVITGAHGLPNRHVIHCLGPMYGVDEPSGELLASCYRESLRLAEEHDVESIAFPALSTGVFGFPMENAARIAAGTIAAATPGLAKVKRIRFVLINERDLAIHERAFRPCIAQIAGGSADDANDSDDAD